MAFAIPPVNVTRNMRGELQAENNFNMSEPGRVLRISTYKGSRGLVTYATCGILYRMKGGGMTGFQFEVFGDFSKTLLTTATRATAKAVAKQQQTALIFGAELALAEAEAYYIATPAKGSKLGKDDIDAREGLEVAA